MKLIKIIKPEEVEIILTNEEVKELFEDLKLSKDQPRFSKTGCDLLNKLKDYSLK